MGCAAGFDVLLKMNVSKCSNMIKVHLYLRLHPLIRGVSQRPMLPSKVPFKYGRHAMINDVSVDM